jgi:hypothetical protein
MANKKIEIDIIINSAQSAKTVGELKNSLQQIKSTLNEIGDEGTDDFNRLNNALTEVSGKLSNVGSAAGSAVNPLDKLKTTAERFDGISKSLAGGVSLAAGAFGLMGGAGEKAAVVLTKVASAIAISNGIKDLSEGFLKLATDTGIASAAQSAYATVVGTSTGALKLFRLALVATGIGAAVVAIGLLIANWDKVSEAVDNATESFDKLGTGVKIAIAAASLPLLPFIALIKLVKEGLEELGLVQSKESAAREEESKKAFKRYEEDKKLFIESSDAKQKELQREIDIQKSLGNDVTKLEIAKREARKQTIDALVRQAELELKLKEKFGLVNGKEIEEIKKLKDEYDNLNTEITIIYNEQIKSNREKNKKIAEDNKKAEDDAKKQREKDANDASKNRNDRNKDELKRIEFEANLRRKAQEEFVKIQEEGVKRRSEIAELESKKRIELLQKEEDERRLSVDRAAESLQYLARIGGGINTLFGDSTILLSNIFDNFSSKIDSFKEKFAVLNDSTASSKDKINAGIGVAIEGLSVISDSLTQVSQVIENNTNRNIENIERQSAVELSALDKKLKDGIISEEAFNQQSFAIQQKAFIDSEKIKQKAFESNKKLQIANAIVTGIQGALAAYASAQILPPPAGPIVGGILAAAVGAFTAVQVAQINKQTYQGGTAPSKASVPTPSIPSGSVSNSPTLSTTSLFGTAGSGSTNQQNQESQSQNVRAYVLESDISGSQARISRYRNAAEIG